ncbi:hypothetical protein Tco_1360121 [Tanacetum coccineum]
MEISIADQIALDDALVAPADRLKIGKCNLRLSSDVTSKEATLQVVYDVLKLTPFYKAFQVTADVPEIYMQEFWVSAYMHNRSVRFKMNNKKHILNLDQFRDILQICPKVGNKKFEEPPLEKEILAFLANLGHSGEIRKITDVNVNKLHQPWRSFAAIINKCLSGKPSYDSLRLSQAQILWGMYNNKKVDYAYLLWEDFTYQIENKNTKKGNAMYYPRFTKLIVNFVMAKDPSIPRRNKVNWHYARDDPMFTTINVISRNEDTQLKIPKDKASKKKADTDATTKQKPPTIPKDKKEKKSRKGKQKAKELETISKAILTEAHEDLVLHQGFPNALIMTQDDISCENQDDEDDDIHDDDENAQDDDDEAQTESEDDGDDFIHPKLTTHDDEIIHEEETDEDDTFDPIVHTPSRISSSDDEDSDNEVEGMDVEGAKSDEDATYVEDQGNEAVEDTNANLEGRDDVMTDVILPQVQATQQIEDTHVTLTPVNPDGPQQSSSVSSGFVSNMLNPNQDTGVDAIFGQQAEATSLTDIPVTTIVEPSFFAPTNRPPTPNPLFIQLQQPPILTPATTPSSSLQNLPDFASLFGFDNRLKALEDNFSELRQTNQYAEALSSIPGIVDHYLANKMQEAVDVAVQLKYDRIREESHTENQQFLDSIDEGMKKVIKEQVKKEVSKITPKIEKLVNEQLESEVLAVYKALVKAYEPTKFCLITYGDTVYNQKDPRDGQLMIKNLRWKTEDSQASASQSAPVEETMQSTDVFEAPAHQEFETGVHDEQAEEEVHHLPDCNLARRQDPRESFDELTDTTFDFSAFVMNRLNVKTLTPELLVGPTFELMKGTCKSLTELEYFCEEVYKATTENTRTRINQEGRQYPHDLRKPLPLVPNSQGRHVIPFHHFINNDLEYLRGGESSRKYSTSVTKTKAVDYGAILNVIERLSAHSMWSSNIGGIKVKLRKIRSLENLTLGQKRRQILHLRPQGNSSDDDILYKFKEGDFHRLRIQDIEDMLLLLVQGKVTNLNVEERIAFNVSLRMFTRSVVIQRRVEDLQLGVESYQKKLNLTKPDTYRSNLRRRDAYTPYSDPRGFIYENKDKKNRLMRIDELHKFSDGTLDDVRIALNDRLKGIRMEYLPQTFWSKWTSKCKSYDSGN